MSWLSQLLLTIAVDTWEKCLSLRKLGNIVKVWVMVLLVDHGGRLAVDPSTLEWRIHEFCLYLWLSWSFPCFSVSDHALSRLSRAVAFTSAIPISTSCKHHVWVLRVKVLLSPILPTDTLLPSEVLISLFLFRHHL